MEVSLHYSKYPYERIHDSLSSVFEALDKKYLAAVMFSVYSIDMEMEPKDLLEKQVNLSISLLLLALMLMLLWCWLSYTFKIQHAANGSTQLSASFAGADPMLCTAENVKAQAIQLIRALVSITNNLDPLPENRLVTIKMEFNGT